MQSKREQILVEPRAYSRGEDIWKWNYRVVRKKGSYIDTTTERERVDYTYAIHEAYYDKHGYVGTITQDPIEPIGENIEELRHSWVMMAEAFGQPILDHDHIHEPRYKREKDPIAAVLDASPKEPEEGIPLEDVLKDLEKKFGPFGEEEFNKQAEEERLEKERIHREVFVGTRSFRELIEKLCSDCLEHICRDRIERPLLARTMRKRKRRNVKAGVTRWPKHRQRSERELQRIQQDRIDYGVYS
jgi:hypothetical protein